MSARATHNMRALLEKQLSEVEMTRARGHVQHAHVVVVDRLHVGARRKQQVDGLEPPRHKSVFGLEIIGVIFGEWWAAGSRGV